MKNVAVITGASSGMGRRFAETVAEFGALPDEIWVIARRLERLSKITAPVPVRPLALDLTVPDAISRYEALLREEKPHVTLLINASGFGKFEATEAIPLSDNLHMIDLNCRALAALCQVTLPYMSAGSRLVNIASVAAFQPIPYINVYAATKAFVLHYSRALNREVRPRGIGVMAVCPFWTRTEFFDHAVNTEKPPVVKKYAAMYAPDQIVSRAWRDLKRGKDISRFGFVARAQEILVKLLPHRWVMSIWMRQQKLP